MPVFLPGQLPRSLEASFRDLSSEKAEVRGSAIQDAVRHALRSDAARDRAVGALVRLLRDDPTAGVRAAAAVGLADIKAAEALPTLLVAVEDPDAHVRQMALCALGEIGDPRAMQRLERALTDVRPEVRYQAVMAFVRVAQDTPGAADAALVGSMGDEDPAIRYIALRIAEERLADMLDPERSDPERTRAARARANPDLSAEAERLLGDADDAVAVVAALYLARLGRDDGRAVVLEVVAETKGTPEREDEQACVELAGELAMRDAVPHLERRVWGSRRWLRALASWGAGDGRSCEWHARIALARMGHERARAEILRDLQSWRRTTRDAAVVAAGRARIPEAQAALEQLENAAESVDLDLVREALGRIASPVG